MNWDIFLPVFVITLRNIFPIALLLGIIVATFQRLQHSEYYRQIYLGISAGIVASILVASFFADGLKSFNSTDYNGWIFTPLIINSSTFISIGLLIWFIFWLGEQGCLWQNIGNTNEILMGKYSKSLVFSLALFLVLPKGIEIVLLLSSQNSNQIVSGSLGAIASSLFMAIITSAFVYLQTRLSDSLFFKCIGILLIFLTGGLVINTIYNLDENIAFINELSNRNNWCLFAEQSCLLGGLLWQDNNSFSENKFPFILLKIIFGYHDHIYLVSLILYLLFIATIVKIYWQKLKNFS